LYCRERQKIRIKSKDQTQLWAIFLMPALQRILWHFKYMMDSLCWATQIEKADVYLEFQGLGKQEQVCIEWSHFTHHCGCNGRQFGQQNPERSRCKRAWPSPGPSLVFYLAYKPSLPMANSNICAENETDSEPPCLVIWRLCERLLSLMAAFDTLSVCGGKRVERVGRVVGG